jgi:hypothetical protein
MVDATIIERIAARMTFRTTGMTRASTRVLSKASRFARFARSLSVVTPTCREQARRFREPDETVNVRYMVDPFIVYDIDVEVAHLRDAGASFPERHISGRRQADLLEDPSGTSWSSFWAPVGSGLAAQALRGCRPASQNDSAVGSGCSSSQASSGSRYQRMTFQSSPSNPTSKLARCRSAPSPSSIAAVHARW